MKNAIVFDLDGTLLNTLDDLCDSTNYALTSVGFPQRKISEVRNFVGNGIYRLVERAVPGNTDKETVDKCYNTFCEHYKKNMANKTKPYPGILEMLKFLYEAGFKMSIVTNKADFAAQKLCGDMFGEYVKTVVGSVPERPNKPAPDGVYEALSKMGAEKDEAVFIGDSEVDIATANNAGLECIGVLWGFRDLDVLESVGVKNTVKNAEELKKMLLNLKK